MTVENLLPGTTYEFAIFSIRNGQESVPVTRTVTTERIGRILVEMADRQVVIGDETVLTCSYDRQIPGNPVIKWSKLGSGGAATELLTYDADAPEDKVQEAESIGDFAGRVSVGEGGSVLTISDIRSSDNGLYECELTYPTGGGRDSARIVVTGRPSPVVITSPEMASLESEYLLQWEAHQAPAIDGFILNIRRRGSTRKMYRFDAPGTARSFMFRNLRGGRTYEGNLAATNGYGTSAATEFAFTTPSSAPPAPTGVQLLSQTPTTIALRVQGQSGRGQFYRITYNRQDTQGITTVDGSLGERDFTLEGLAPNSAQVLRIYSVNVNAQSEPLVVNVTMPQQRPPVPQGITLEDIGSRFAQLSITNDNDDGVLYYEIGYRPSSDGEAEPTITRTRSKQFALVLEPAVKYTVDIVAVTADSRSLPVTTFVTTPKELTLPLAPSDFTQIVPRETSVLVEWTGPTENVQSYVVRYQGTSPSETETVILETPPSGVAIQRTTIEGLNPGQDYRVSVKAVGEAGSSPWLTQNFRTLSAVVEPTPATPLAPTGMQFVDESNSVFRFRIDDSEAAEYYVVEYGVDGDVNSNFNRIRSRTSAVVISGLVPATRYLIRVYAVRDGLPSSPYVKYFTPAEAPQPILATEVRVTNADEDLVALVWTLPDGGNGIRTVFVEYSEESGSGQPSRRKYVSPNTPYTTIRGLRPNTIYVGNVTTIRQAGGEQGVASFRFRTRVRTTTASTTTTPTTTTPTTTTTTSTTTTTTTPRPTVTFAPSVASAAPPRVVEPTPARVEPERPVGVVVPRVQDDQAVLRWRAVPGGQVDEYRVEYGPTFTRYGSTKTIRVVSSATSVVLPHLIPGVEYKVRIYSVKGDVQSAPARATFIAKMPAPTDLRAMPTANHNIHVTWANPNATRAGTRLQYRTRSSRGWREELLSPDVEEFVIPYRSGDDQLLVNVTAIGGNIASRAVTLAIFLRMSNSTSQRQSVRVNDVGSNGASVIVSSDEITGGWTLTLLDENGAVVGTPGEFPGTSTLERLVTLRPGRKYSVVVSSSERGDEIGRAEFMTKVAKPTGVRADDVSNSGATLTWRRPSSEINGYLIRYRPNDGRSQWMSTEVSSSRQEYRLTNLQPNQMYEVTVTPTYVDLVADQYKATGETSLLRFNTAPAPVRGGGEVTRRPLSQPATVRPPSSIRLSTSSPTSARIQWTPSPDSVDGYRIVLIDHETGKAIASTMSRSSFAEFHQLAPDTAYDFDVRAVTGRVSSEPARASFYTGVAQPRSIVFDRVGVTSFAARWPGGIRGSTYNVTIREVDSDAAAVSTIVTTNSAEFPDLKPATTYEVAVRVVGSASATPRVSTITTRLFAPQQVRVQDLSPTRFAVSWNSPHAEINEYLIEYQVTGGVDVERERIADERYTITDAEPGTNYTVMISSVYHNTRSRPLRITHTTLPGVAPTRKGEETVTTESEVGIEKTATISWEYSGGLSFSRYRITATPTDNIKATVLTWERGPEATGLRLDGLYPGTRYTVTVEGFSGGSYFPITQDQVITTDIDSPQGLQVTKKTGTSLTLTWEPPRAPITGYILTYQLIGSGEEIAVLPAPKKQATRMTVDDLLPGKRYLLRLFARSDTQDSAETSIWAETAVPKPKRLLTDQATPNIVGLTWEKPGDGITHYTLRVEEGLGHRRVVDDVRLRSDATSYTVRNLKPATRYRFFLTAWMGDISSPPAYRSRHTASTVSSVTSVETGEMTDSGYLVSWRGRSRTVDGWKIVVEPQDGGESWEQIVDRFTKQYELENLRHDVEYVVKIYPYSGTLVGSPSVIRIPASSGSDSYVTRQRETTTSSWQVTVPTVSVDSAQIRWIRPWDDVQGYRLQYKRVGDSDAGFRDVIPQPAVGDLSSTLSRLDAGQIYTIKLTAFKVVGGETSEATLMLNVTTPIPGPREVTMEQRGSNTVFSWTAPATRPTGYVVKYKEVDPNSNNEFVVRSLNGDATSVSIPSLVEGQEYEIRIYATRGQYSSSVQAFRVIPGAVGDYCEDPTTRRRYDVGQHWISNANGFRMNCSCNAPQSFDCSSGDWCHADGAVYEPGQRWNVVRDDNRKETCVCEGRLGYKCYPQNCLDDGEWYDSGTRWTSRSTGMMCSCSCPPQFNRSCQKTCELPSS